MRKHFLLLIFAFIVNAAYASDATRVVNNGQPFSFWYWMYGAVTKQAIRADLEGMKHVGLRGTYLMPIRGADERPEYEGKAQQLTPEFWDAVEYAMHCADSLGLELGVHICDGFALAGGPWFTPEESMQKVVWRDTIVNIPAQKGKKALRRGQRTASSTPLVLLPAEGSADIAAYAIPVGYTRCEVKPLSLTTSSGVTSDAKNLIRANDPCWFTFEFPEGTLLRNVEIFPSGTNIQCQRLKVEVSNDGTTFLPLTVFTPARQGWQNTDAANTFALPQDDSLRGRFYRFSWTPEGTEPGSEDLDAGKWKPTLRLKKIVFHEDPRIHQWEGKAAYVWRVAETTTESQLPASLCTPLNAVLPVTFSPEGTLLTELPSGTYRIIRMGHATTGHTNATAGGGKGLECDKFSAAAVNKLVDNWFAQFAALPSAKALKYMHIDSWECGCQNWSRSFAKEFQSRRGYDLLPWLPVMAGIPLESAAESERVLRDVRLTVNDLINDVFFTTLRERAHAMGMQFSSESIAPTMCADGLDHYRYADYPMGEYWLNSPTHDKPNDMLDAISGAHVYGKNIVQAEGFTELRGVWDEHPAMLKTLLDRNFAMGMNRLFFHVNAHNPWLDRRPGMTLDGIGLFFQRDQIWYEESAPFVDYITRCSALLQQGRPVQDIAVFIGEEMPRRSVLPERLVPMLPGIFGAERVASEQKRLANIGEPMEESPVGVNHSAGVVDTKDWVNSLRGYQYDSFNPDVLLRLAKVEDGRMTLPGGASYRVVVLPGKRPMDPSFAGYSKEVEEKLAMLRKGGVAVVDSPYMAEDFTQYGLRRDVELPEGIAYAHRSGSQGEIYFLSNQAEQCRAFTAVFRDTAAGKAYIYCPVTNTIAEAVAVDGKIDLTLNQSASCFVLFPADNVERITACLPQAPRQAVSVYCHAATEPCRGTSSYDITGPYTLTLRENGVSKTLETLTDWSADTDDKVRYFSGHGRYTVTVKSGKPRGDEVLTLGEVHEIAHVWVNGIDCGITWIAPYEVKIGHALRRGKNTIEIEVVNTWANAIRGNDDGKAPYDGIWTNARYRSKSKQLLPSGLLGPLTIRRGGN